jgi:hypothetical protein
MGLMGRLRRDATARPTCRILSTCSSDVEGWKVYLRPSRDRHLRLALVEESGLAIRDVEAEGWRDGETPLVPEAGDDGDVRALAQVTDELAMLLYNATISDGEKD